MKKYFSSPDEVNVELPTNIVIAIQYVEDQLKKHNFKFNPPYNIKRHGGSLVDLLKQSGWSLTIQHESDWEIKPLK